MSATVESSVLQTEMGPSSYSRKEEIKIKKIMIELEQQARKAHTNLKHNSNPCIQWRQWEFHFLKPSPLQGHVVKLWSHLWAIQSSDLKGYIIVQENGESRVDTTVIRKLSGLFCSTPTMSLHMQDYLMVLFIFGCVYEFILVRNSMTMSREKRGTDRSIRD